MVWIRDIKKRTKYYEETNAKAPSAFLVKTLKFAKGNKAIDLGCGSGVETREIAKNGFSIVAVDVNKDVKKYFSKEDLKNIKLKIQSIENFRFVKCDFVFAKSSLVFLSPGKFYKVLENIKKSLKPGGIFAARLWGKKDSDNRSGKNHKCTFVSMDKLKNTFLGYKFLEIVEHEEDKFGADGRMKHWDFIDVIIQKPI